MKNDVSKNKKSIVITMTSLLLVTLILLGLTYAYYKTRIVGNTNEKSVSVTSKNLSVTYQNESAVIDAKGIEPGYTATKTFEVTNTGSTSVRYSVMLDNVTNKFTRPQDWTYTISENETELKSDTLPNNDSYILYSESIDAGVTKSYTLVINYAYLEDVDQSDDMGASLSFRINIGEEYFQTWENATNGTLLYAIKNSTKTVDGETVSMVVSTPTSIPGQAVTAESEAEIASTEDDYGKSYYYRGNVTNNYVNYSGMCWRIVRIQGDGGVKLVLADENGECNAETYSTSNTKSAFIDGRTDIAYKTSKKNDATDFLFEDSNIPAILNGWKASKNLDTSKLVDTEWCNDTAVASTTGWGQDALGGTTGNKSEAVIWYTDLFFVGYDRLFDVSSAKPTLKCNTKGIEGTEGIEAESQKYRNKLGILSADEVAFAGTTSFQDNTTYTYLKTNASGNSYWTMTPSMMYGNSDSGIYVLGSNGLIYAAGVDLLNSDSVRPAIVLNSNVTITEGGDGTQTNPYVIS